MGVWPVLAGESADRLAGPVRVAHSLFQLAYDGGVKNLPEGQSALQFTRSQLDRLKLGRDLTRLPWGSKTFRLPPSTLTD